MGRMLISATETIVNCTIYHIRLACFTTYLALTAMREKDSDINTIYSEKSLLTGNVQYSTDQPEARKLGLTGFDQSFSGYW